MTHLSIPCLFCSSTHPSTLLKRFPELLESLLLNLAFVTSDGVVSLVSIGDKVFASKCLYPAVCSVFLCWCLDWSYDRYFSSKSIYPLLLFIMLVTVFVASTTGCSIPITTSCSIPHPLIQVLSRFSNLIMGDELILRVGILASLVVNLCLSPSPWCGQYAVLNLWYSNPFPFKCGSLLD